MDYTVLIPIAAYLIAVQLATRTNVHPAVSTCVAILLPWLVSLTLHYIFESGYGLVNFGGLFSLYSLLLVCVQFLCGVVIFKQLRDEESVGAMLAWGVGGFVIILILLPYIAKILVL